MTYTFRLVPRRYVLFLCVCAMFVTNEALAQRAPPAPAKVQVAGSVENKLELGIEDLRRLAVQHVEDVRQVRIGRGGVEGKASRRAATPAYCCAT